MLRNKIQLILLAGAILCLFAGCTREVFQDDTREGALLARIEGGTDTKVSFDSTEGKFAWTEGDEIAIWFTNGTAGNFENVPVNPANGSVIASATSGTHRDLYAIYPATAAVAANYGNPTLQVTLPASYDITDIVAGNKTADFSPMPMVALNTETSSYIDFYHVGGLLRIICQGVPTGTKTIKVTMDKDVAGTYTVNNLDTFATSAPSPTITTAGSASNNVVVFTVSESGLTSDTDITLNLPVPCGTYQTVTVGAYGDDAGTPLFSRTFERDRMVFERHHGKKVELREVSFLFVMSNLSSVTTGLAEAGGYRVLSSNFQSYKTDGEVEEKVPFELEISLDNGETWLERSAWPEWVSVDDSAIDYSGSTPASPQTIGITLSPLVDRNTDPHHEELASRQKKDYFDLSTINVATGLTVERTTANCYVVQSPGTYKFPLVYGNAVQGGATATSSYTAPSSTNSSWYGILVDHRGASITNPYIPQNLSDASMTAELLWTDAPGLVDGVEYLKGDEADLTDDYIAFNVPEEYITQGNAMIAVFAADGTIAWSWHIWITDANLTDLREVSNGYRIPTVNVGWCDKRISDYEGRTIRVRAVQDVSGNVKAAAVTQQGNSVTINGNSPYYQWGRKDPSRAAMNNTTFRTYYPTKAAYRPRNESRPSGASNAATVQETITHPYIHYGRADHYIWQGTVITNLWSINASATGAKTIYDPSPVGFRVPATNAFSTLTVNNTTWGVVDGIRGRTVNANDVFLPALGQYGNMNGGGLGAVGTDGNYACRLWNGLSYASMFYFSASTVENPSNAPGRSYSLRPIAE